MVRVQTTLCTHTGAAAFGVDDGDNIKIQDTKNKVEDDNLGKKKDGFL